MSTFIINLNDTTALSDSVVAKVIKLSEAFQPAVTEAESNNNDVMIVAFICIAIVVVALIAKWAAWSWQNAEIASRVKERSDKREKDEEDYQRKQKAEEKSRSMQKEDQAHKESDEQKRRTWQHENEDREQKAEFLNKYIEFIKEQSENGNYDISIYRETLARIIEFSQKGKLSEITEDNLNAIFKKGV